MRAYLEAACCARSVLLLNARVHVRACVRALGVIIGIVIAAKSWTAESALARALNLVNLETPLLSNAATAAAVARYAVHCRSFFDRPRGLRGHRVHQMRNGL